MTFHKEAVKRRYNEYDWIRFRYYDKLGEFKYIRLRVEEFSAEFQAFIWKTR